jgi:glycerophosphoryl diester phosphodiesterase
MAHGGGLGHGRENSLEAIREALKYNPDIIEVDVRRSRDGILYCHHGSIPFGVFAAQFFGFLSFRRIQQLIGKIDLLQPVIEAVPPSVDIYLDLKSTDITSADLRPLVSGKLNIWVTTYSVSQLRELRSGLGENFVYVLNRPLVWVRIREIFKLVGLVDMIQIGRWQWSTVVISDIEANGIACHLAHWFLTTDEQRDKMAAASPFKGVFLHYDDLSKMTR